MQLPQAYRSLPRLSSKPKPSYLSNSLIDFTFKCQRIPLLISLNMKTTSRFFSIFPFVIAGRFLQLPPTEIAKLFVWCSQNDIAKNCNTIFTHLVNISCDITNSSLFRKIWINSQMLSTKAYGPAVNWTRSSSVFDIVINDFAKKFALCANEVFCR